MLRVCQRYDNGVPRHLECDIDKQRMYPGDKSVPYMS